MFIYVGRTHTVRVQGQRLIDVTCESCHRRYGYLMHRIAQGQASSPYMVGTSTGDQRASNRATARLHKVLDKQCDVVPCPACGHIQNEMVEVWRSTHGRWMGMTGRIMLLLIPVWALLALWVGSIFQNSSVFVGLVLGWIVIAIGLLFLRRLQSRHADPNGINVEVRRLLGAYSAFNEEQLAHLHRMDSPTRTADAVAGP